MNRLMSIDPEARTATVQPGVILSDLQRAAAQYGLRFGPDPSTQARCTIGGMIGNNACGAHALSYGRTGDNLGSLSLLLAHGESVQVSTLESADPGITPLTNLVRDNLEDDTD
jgi:FAD/FMN-containing dehydrogenase